MSKNIITTAWHISFFAINAMTMMIIIYLTKKGYFIDNIYLHGAIYVIPTLVYVVFFTKFAKRYRK